MKFHYSGKYSGNPDDLPYREHEPGAVAFKEPKDSKTLGRIANGIALVLFIPLLIVYIMLAEGPNMGFPALLVYLVSLVPHEFLHAICFKEDVYMYTNLRQGMLFVVGPERMSKARFVFMSMLPNLVFGFIPFTIFIIDPTKTFLGFFGLLSIPSGAGDYLNVFNALTQVPNGGRVYLHKFNSFWYMPEDTKGGK